MRKARSIQWLKCLVIAFSVLAVAYLGRSGVISAKAATEVASGNCGDIHNNGGQSSVKWTLDSDGVLTISGNGKMGNYKYRFGVLSPWNSKGETIKTITIESGVTSIGDAAFSGCSGLTSITIPSGVTSIGDHAFYDCGNLTDITIPNGVTSIGNYAFRQCSRLEDITIPASVTSIGEYAFWDCSVLTSITIPSGVASIGDHAFAGTSSLTAINVDEGNIYYSSSDGVVYSKDGKSILFYPIGKIGSFTIPDSVASIVDYAFYGCRGLSEIVIPDNVTSMGNYAFSNCSGLTSVTIGAGVTSIGQYAFGNCSGLPDITIPASVTSIGAEAFASCSDLTSITIPASVTSIGRFVFSPCSSMTEINVESENANYSSVDGVVYSKDGKSILFCPTGKRGSFSVPSDVTSIGAYAFYDCGSLTDITIPASVTSIGAEAFAGCIGLTSITILDSMPSVGAGAFSDCDNLSTVYYKGNKKQWNTWKTIWVDAYNDKLLKATLICQPTFTPPTTQSLVCIGKAQALLDGGSSDEGTLQYALGTDAKTAPDAGWTVEVPGATNVGTYYVWYKVLGGEGYLDVDPVCLTVTVSKAATAPNKLAASMSVAYSVDKVSKVSLADYTGWEWQASDKDKPLTVGGKVSATAIYTASDKDNYETTSVTVEITRTACKHENTEVKDKKDATCTADGYTGDTYCKVCGEKTAAGTAVKATGHKWDGGKVTTEPTTEKEGVRTYTCTVCKETKTEAVGKLPAPTPEPTPTPEPAPTPEHKHSYKDSVTKAATCTEDGVKTYKCDCGDSYTEAIKATGHKWDEGKVTTEPTTKAEGVKTYTCGNCKETKTEAVPKLKSKEEIAVENKTTGFVPSEEGGESFWYEDGEKQGVKLKEDGTPDESYRGKEIYDPETDEWYWLDNIQYGAIAKGKDVYQESQADDEGNIGKWVRYDDNGHMVKGWDTNGDGAYYFDPKYGTMLKGDQVIDGVTYHFNEDTGIMDSCSISLENHWETIDGEDYWYENGQRQGRDAAHKDYRGKEIYDPETDAWYWLDNVDAGKKAVSKDVYQESLAGEWGDYIYEDGVEVRDAEEVQAADADARYGKWVRYDKDGRMVKGWCAGKDADAKTITSPDDAGDEAVYYFDPTYGTMAKGKAVIDGVEYYFNPDTGVLER